MHAPMIRPDMSKWTCDRDATAHAGDAGIAHWALILTAGCGFRPLGAGTDRWALLGADHRELGGGERVGLERGCVHKEHDLIWVSQLCS